MEFISQTTTANAFQHWSNFSINLKESIHWPRCM